MKPRKREHARERGYTMFELMIVVGLIAVMAVLALPGISSYFRISSRSAAREMGATIKETFNATAVTGRVHRLACDLKNGEYWVESGPVGALLENAQSRELDERLGRARRNRSKSSNLLTDGEAEAPPSFALETSVTRKKIVLPRGVKFEDVISEQSDEPIRDGMAYAHFFLTA